MRRALGALSSNSGDASTSASGCAREASRSFGEHWQRRVKEAGADGPLGRPSPQAWFATLWDKLYGTWGQNPWVAVYEWGKIEVAK
jgi:hypothetical protein